MNGGEDGGTCDESAMCKLSCFADHYAERSYAYSFRKCFACKVCEM